MARVDDVTGENDPVRSFLDGGLAAEAGLRPADLAVGLEVARNHLGRGAAREALRVYIGLILCEPTNVDVQVGLANCAIQLGEDHLALQAASAVIALAPRDPRGYYLSGRACLGLGQHAEAAEDLADAVARARDARDPDVGEQAQRLLAGLKAPAGAALS